MTRNAIRKEEISIQGDKKMKMNVLRGMAALALTVTSISITGCEGNSDDPEIAGTNTNGTVVYQDENSSTGYATEGGEEISYSPDTTPADGTASTPVGDTYNPGDDHVTSGGGTYDVGTANTSGGDSGVDTGSTVGDGTSGGGDGSAGGGNDGGTGDDEIIVVGPGW